MSDEVTLGEIHSVVLNFLKGRVDSMVFGAQAVNLYVDEPRMTQDVYLKEYASGDETYTSLNCFFEYYDYDRPHQGLGSKTPWEVYRPQRKRRHVGSI